jgi:hypothetical protein
MSKTVFISGPVSDLPYNEVVKAFNGAEQRLRRQGYVVKNPVRLCYPHWSWRRCMVVCLANLITVGAVYMLAGWRESRGARIEHRVARFFGKRVMYEFER